MPGQRFLELLYAGAAPEAYDAVVAEAERGRASPDHVAELRRQADRALRLAERMRRQQDREAELTALNETAHDLISIRDVDTILAAIVRRARQLLNADMTYLSLNDSAEGASFMKVTDGSISAEFRNLLLPLGTGLLGLLAVHRTVRAFPSSEVSLLTALGGQVRVFDDAGTPVVGEGDLAGDLAGELADAAEESRTSGRCVSRPAPSRSSRPCWSAPSPGPGSSSTSSPPWRSRRSSWRSWSR